jgi:predicted nuclease of predicted toxin-antitoxin system
LKILLDECVDRKLSRDLIGHAVITVTRRGWAGIKNGDLLALAEREFDIFITVDRKLSTQQDLKKFEIAVVLLRASSNRLTDLRVLVPALLEKLPLASTGGLTIIGG